jgi:hypothetical protein
LGELLDELDEWLFTDNDSINENRLERMALWVSKLRNCQKGFVAWLVFKDEFQSMMKTFYERITELGNDPDWNEWERVPAECFFEPMEHETYAQWGVEQWSKDDFRDIYNIVRIENRGDLVSNSYPEKWQDMHESLAEG